MSKFNLQVIGSIQETLGKAQIRTAMASIFKSIRILDSDMFYICNRFTTCAYNYRLSVHAVQLLKLAVTASVYMNECMGSLPFS